MKSCFRTWSVTAGADTRRLCIHPLQTEVEQADVWEEVRYQARSAAELSQRHWLVGPNRRPPDQIEGK